MTPSSIKKFQSHIRKRRATNRRDLPWRKTTDPYKIWISETMLCQTQVNRVIVYYNDWMKLFPTVEDLAQATNTEVLSARSGLGYNSRGLRLRSAAQQVISYKSQVISCLNSREEIGKNNSTLNTQHLTLPTTYEQLIALP